MTRDLGAVFGGLAAGLAMSLVMEVGRQTGLLHRTLAEEAEDWLDRVANTRAHIGHSGTRAIEQANHMAASAAFGIGYSLLRKRVPALPAWGLGILYSVGLYAINIAAIAPLLGLTEGEQNAPAPVRAERLALHVLYGVLTALVAEKLTSQSPS